MADASSQSLALTGEAMLYVPIGGEVDVPVVLADNRSPGALDAIHAAIKQLRPRAVVRTESLAANVEQGLSASRVGAAIAGLLGVLALVIASVGTMGVFGYVVGPRTREIGIRRALGAPPSHVLQSILTSSLRPLVVGLVVGLAMAAGVSFALVRVLPGVRSMDPATYAGVVVLFTGAVLLASAVPARRALKVDPVSALRWE